MYHQVEANNRQPRVAMGQHEADREVVQSARVRSSGSPSGIQLGDAIVQARLTVGPVDDVHEREADEVAVRVVRSLRSTETAAESDPAALIHRTTAAPPRRPAPTRTGQLQRAAKIGADGGDLDNDTAQMLRSSRSGGRPLPDVARSTMEGAFGADFSSIRIHAGATSTELNDRIQAKAFTTGSDIYFRDGLPDMSTSGGQGLLAHELTHTIQQGHAAVQRTTEVIQRTGRTPEQENDAKTKFVNHFAEQFDDVKWLETSEGWKSLKEAAGNVWEKMKLTLDSTAPIMDLVPKDDATGYGKVVEKAATSRGVQVIGADPQYRKALDAASSFSEMLKALTKQSTKSRKLASLGFAFWSGEPAKAAAKNSGLQSLEGSQLGGEFEGGSGALPEGTDMSIWGSVSEAYAGWSVESMRGKKYRGFVGVGGDRDDNIYNSVERWVFEKGAQGKLVGIDFELSWHAVVPKDAAYREQAETGAPHLSRDAYAAGDSEVGPSRGFNSRGGAVKAMQQAHKERTEAAKAAKAEVEAAKRS
jgi:hypothetical protein